MAGDRWLRLETDGFSRGITSSFDTAGFNICNIIVVYGVTNLPLYKSLLAKTTSPFTGVITIIQHPHET